MALCLMLFGEAVHHKLWIQLERVSCNVLDVCQNRTIRPPAVRHRTRLILALPLMASLTHGLLI